MNDKKSEKEIRSCLPERRTQRANRFYGRAARGKNRSLRQFASPLHRFEHLALTRFSAEEQRRIGIHTCPGSDRDSTSDRNIEHPRVESEGYEGRDYSLRVRPYRTADNKIDGAVIMLVDLEEGRRAMPVKRQSARSKSSRTSKKQRRADYREITASAGGAARELIRAGMKNKREPLMPPGNF